MRSNRSTTKRKETMANIPTNPIINEDSPERSDAPQTSARKPIGQSKVFDMAALREI